MGAFTNWNYNNWHELNLDFILSEMKTATEEWNRFYNDIESDFENLKNYVYDYFKNLDLTSEVSAIIEQMYNDGDFDEILKRLVLDYQFEQPELFSEFASLSQYYEELDNLANDSEWLQSLNIGTSVMGYPIKCYVIGKPKNENQYFRKGLIFGNQHAREYQAVFVLANAIKTIVNNLENETGSVKGVSFKSLFEGYQLFIVPCDNPDGYRLCVEDYYNDLPESRKTAIATMVEDFIKGGYTNENDFTPEYLAELIAEFGSLDNYSFRAKDIPHVWNANIDGIDLHYNCFNDATYNYVRSYSIQQGFPQEPAPRNFIGTTAFECPENQAIKNIITAYNITSVLDLHQRGPTMFFQYKYGGNKFERNKFISQQISDATQTPVSRANNGPVGFMGWYHNTYTGDDYFGAIKEIGWSRVDILVNGASNPLDTSGYMTNPMPRNLQNKVYYREINGLLAFMYNAVCNMCINQFYMGLNIVDTASQTPNNNTDAQTLVDVAFFKSNAVYKYVVRSTELTLAQLVASYPQDSIIILDQPNATNTPNIKLAGTSTQNKIFIYKHSSFSYAIQINSQDDAYMCVITSSTSTNWDMISSRVNRVEITNNASGSGSASNVAGTLFFDPIVTPSINAFDSFVRYTISDYGNYKTVNLYTKGEANATVNVDYHITSKEYPSV